MKRGCLPILLIVVILLIYFGILIVRDQVFGQQFNPINSTLQPNGQLPVQVQNVPQNIPPSAQVPNYTFPIAPPSPPPAPLASNKQVIVQPNPDPPKWLVEFTHIDDPTNPTQKIMAITVVDPESKRILIYHANLSFGALKFISSRDILPDIMLGEYNAVSPTPREIIAEIERLKNNK
ncbi:MAG: hypothetical protein LBP59_16720 [Planctomycetaceae bacterium]|jgi:hypothetical protein|nr:hypothetical protein [Planctomycetaceae bacterium]